MKLSFVLKDKLNNFVAIDIASGGYPYLVKDIFQAKIWQDIMEMTEWLNSFYMNEYTIHQITGFSEKERPDILQLSKDLMNKDLELRTIQQQINAIK